MHKGAIIDKNPDHIVPEEVLAQTLEKYPTTFGVVIAHEGQLDVSANDTPLSLDDIKELQESFKDNRLIMYFGNYPKEFHSDDVQPFTILSKEKDAQLVAFVDGDFDPYHQKESNHSNAFFFINSQLIEKVKQLDRLVGHDLGKLIGELKQPGFKRDMEMSSSMYCDITLLAADGTVLQFGKNNPQRASFDWGNVSDSQAVADEASPAETKKAGILAKLGIGSKKAGPADMADLQRAKTEPKLDKGTNIGDTNKAGGFQFGRQQSVPEVKPEPPKTETAAATVRPKEGIQLLPIPPHMKREDKKKWLRNNAPGKLPHNWEDMEVVVVDTKNKTRTLKTFKDLPADLVQPKSTETPTKEAPKEQPAAAPDVKPAEEQPHQFEVLPVAPPDEQKEFTTSFMKSEVVIKALDKQSQVIPHPGKDANEKKLPSFEEQTGIALSRMAKMPPHIRKEFCEEFPHLAAILIGEVFAIIGVPEAPAETKAAPAAAVQQRSGFQFGRTAG